MKSHGEDALEEEPNPVVEPAQLNGHTVIRKTPMPIIAPAGVNARAPKAARDYAYEHGQDGVFALLGFFDSMKTLNARADRNSSETACTETERTENDQYDS